MANQEEWHLSVDEETEALKLVSLRDRALAECTPTQSRRLEIEKRVRSNYRDNSDYKKHIRNGRYDLIPKNLRDSIFTSQQTLENAYYDNYKPRAERDEADQQHEQTETQTSAHSKTSHREGFYDDSVRDTADGSSDYTDNPGITYGHQQPSSQSPAQDTHTMPAGFPPYSAPYGVTYPPAWGILPPHQMYYMPQMAPFPTVAGTAQQAPQEQDQMQQQQQLYQFWSQQWAQQNGNKNLQPY